MRMVTHCKTTLLVLALLSFMVSLNSASAANNTESSLGSPSVIFAAGKGGAGIDHRPQAGPIDAKGKREGEKEEKATTCHKMSGYRTDLWNPRGCTLVFLQRGRE